MLKVIIVGCPGAGKSTFARKLNQITNLPLYHKPDRTNIYKEKFDEELKKILKKDKWIMDGNYQRTLEMRLKECDTAFLLDYPLEVCLSGAQSRIGKKREDLPWLEEKFDENFKNWILNFEKEKLPQIYDLLDKYKENKNIVIFKSREEADNYIKNIIKE